MDPRIEHLLKQVATRYRRRSFAWILAASWLVLGLFFVLSLQSWKLDSDSPLSSSKLPTWSRWLPLLFLLTVAFSWIASRFTKQDYRQVASEIERRFPNLKQRLLTAIGIERAEAKGFIRQSLLDDTIQHSKSYDWNQTVSTRSLLGAWIAQFVTLSLCLTAAAGLLWSSQRSTSEPHAALLPGIPSSVQVEPGNTEIERGTNLIVTAKFSPRVPAEVWLEAKGSNTGSIARQEMRRNLKDPIYGGYLLEVKENSEYVVDYLDGKSQSYQIKVFDFPALVQADATIVSPKYSRIEDRTVANTRRVTVVDGATLTWTCHVNKPLQSVVLRDDDGNETSLVNSPEEPLLYTARFEMSETTRWKLELIDEQGRKGKIEESLSAKVLPNLPPDTKLAQASDQSVSPLEELVIKGTASDDYGIRRVGIAYSLGGNEPTELVLAQGDSLGKKAEVETLIDFEQLNAQPDQLLNYYFWVEDFDRDGEVRRSDGDMFFAEVRPFEEIFRQGQSMSAEQQQQQQQQQQSQAGQQAEKVAELQKKIITSTWNILRREKPKKLSNEFASDTELLATSQQDALDLAGKMEEEIKDAQSKAFLEKVQADMKQAIESLTKASVNSDLREVRPALTSEQSAYEGLLKLRAREHQIVRSQQQRNQQSQGSASQQNRQQQLEQLKLEDDQDRFETERKASEPEEKGEKEMRQVMNRLDELARRQKDINQQLKDLETAIQEAKTEQAKEELEEQLKRLRENQEELLRDSDELLEKMNEAKNQDAMQDAKQRMEQAREDLQKSAQALSQNQTAPALSSGTRAQRQMDETREQLRQQSSNQFEKAMRDMVEEATELEKRQKELNKKTLGDVNPVTKPSNQEDRGGLRPDGDAPPETSLKEEWKEQKKELDRLLQEIQDTVSEAESSEPLLAEELYDSFRNTKQKGLEPKFDQIPMMVERRMDGPARQAAEEVERGVGELRQRIEKASERVLGSEQESLRRALSELENLKSQLNQEIQQRTGESPTDDSKSDAKSKSRDAKNGERSQASNAQGEPSKEPSEQQGDEPGKEPSEQANEGQANKGQPSNGQQREGQQSRQQGRNGQQANREGQPNQSEPQQEQQAQQDQQAPGERGAGARNQGERNADNRGAAQRGDPRGDRRGALDRLANETRLGAPLTGNDFAEWSDSLRDVEEMVRDPELRAEAARIREAARDMRKDFLRHSKEPQWDLVKRLVAQPLEQLRQSVEQQLLRESAEKNAVVPIDRDPVPNEYQQRLQKYYENLGSGSK